MKHIAVFAVLSLAAGVSLAQTPTCASEIKAIDAAITARGKDLDEKTLNKARNLRTKGEAYCKAGKQADGLSSLGLAKELLGGR